MYISKNAYKVPIANYVIGRFVIYWYFYKLVALKTKSDLQGKNVTSARNDWN